MALCKEDNDRQTFYVLAGTLDDLVLTLIDLEDTISALSQRVESCNNDFLAIQKFDQVLQTANDVRNLLFSASTGVRGKELVNVAKLESTRRALLNRSEEPDVRATSGSIEFF